MPHIQVASLEIGNVPCRVARWKILTSQGESHRTLAFTNNNRTLLDISNPEPLSDEVLKYFILNTLRDQKKI